MKIEIKNLNAADEIRPIEKGRLELYTTGGVICPMNYRDSIHEA